MDERSLNWHIAYRAMPDQQKLAVDSAVKHVMDCVKKMGLRASGDDRAAVLTAAVARYVVECQKP